MKKTYVVFSILLFSAIAQDALAQAPAITGVTNNYSFTIPGLPNYGIAQGSIFVIFGSGLANTSTGLQSAPLQTTLNGVSATVTVNGTVKQVLLYYVTPKQIAAVLPSSVPAGTGQIIVSSNGATSAPAPIVVVQSAFGIMTLNNGTGPAAAFDSRYNLLGSANAANPGETVLLCGTGLGPVSDDNQQSPVSVPVEVLIGGVPAGIIYQGRSQYTGLDQLNVVMPGGLSGCYVSVVVKSGTIVSNYSSVPIAANGRTCSDPTTGPGGLSSAQLPSLAGKTTITTAAIGLFKINISTPAVIFNGTTISPALSYASDLGSAVFSRMTLPQSYDTYVGSAASNRVASVGSCSVYTYSSDTATPTTPTTPATPTPPVAPGPTVTTVNLNAGPALNVSGPNGRKSLPAGNTGYSGTLGGGTGATALPAFIPPNGGTFTIDNGTGGPDVGPFSVQLNFNAATWSNMASIGTVNRSQGVTVTWTGGDTDAYVNIVGTSAASSGTKYVYGSFTCTASAAARQFTVPSAVLLAIPPTGTLSTGGISLPLPGSLVVSSFTVSTALKIPGFDIAYAYALSSSSAPATYQ